MFLNLDAGELDTETEELWQLFDVLNCACGGHAGDVVSMDRVAAYCARTTRPTTRLGAHPSYPDREQLGRRSLPIEPTLLVRHIAAQCGALAGIAKSHGIGVGLVKPHGALYHDAAAHPIVADAVVRGAMAALGSNVIVIGPPAGALRVLADRRGLRYIREGFADRRTRADGTLVPRDEPGAVIGDPQAAAVQAASLVHQVDTICIHADTPDALAIARAVRSSLDALDATAPVKRDA